jgi:hypothetical protein
VAGKTATLLYNSKAGPLAWIEDKRPKGKVVTSSECGYVVGVRIFAAARCWVDQRSQHMPCYMLVNLCKLCRLAEAMPEGQQVPKLLSDFNNWAFFNLYPCLVICHVI